MSSNKILKPIKRVLSFLPDRVYIQLYYFAKFRKPCRLRNPHTYNEKLQWLKLNYRVPADSALVDKHDVKSIVSDVIGKDHVIPTLGVYESADEINFDELPTSFVLKCTHDSEGVALVKDKHLADETAIRQQLDEALSKNFYSIGREPYYRNLTPRIIAEPFLEDANYGELRDYKFFCFDGVVKAMFIASGRASGDLRFDYFDRDFASLDVRQKYPRSTTPPAKPETYSEMIAIAEKLAQGHPHVRVDLYEVDGHVYFGEMTFFHFSGFAPFHPEAFDRRWGDWLKLPTPTTAP